MLTAALAGGIAYARQSGANPPSEAATLLVAGPEGGLLDRWSRVVQPALARGLPPTTSLTLAAIGGADGVTGANQFATRGEPDGRTLLLAPGDTAVAWMVGDPRAKFDPGHWMPVMTCVTPGVLVTRPNARGPLRLALPAVTSPVLAGLLGLEILGISASPVPMVSADATAAYGKGAVDAVLAIGHRVDEQLRALMALGARPAFALGGWTDSDRPVRDSYFPDLPILTELLTGDSPLLGAYRAASTAARLEFMLVLPHLTPAARVAIWRQAATEAVAADDVTALADSLGARPIGGAETAACARAAIPPAPALAMLRDWLGKRHNWRPA
jgi:hypothetical protein